MSLTFPAVTNNNQEAVYMFVRSGTTWTQQATLTSRDGCSRRSFGWSVSSLGDYVIIGAPSKAIGSKSFQGKAYIYVRSDTT